MSVYRLTTVVNKKENFPLMKKYLEGKICADEQSKLLQTFGFSTKEEFALFLKNYLINKEKVHNKFSELQNWEAVKNQVFSASAVVLKTNCILNPTQEECWQIWLLCNSAGMSYCMLEPDWQTCMWWFLGICLGEYGICVGQIE